MQKIFGLGFSACILSFSLSAGECCCGSTVSMGEEWEQPLPWDSNQVVAEESSQSSVGHASIEEFLVQGTNGSEVEFSNVDLSVLEQLLEDETLAAWEREAIESAIQKKKAERTIIAEHPQKQPGNVAPAGSI